jgi:hypothetical protein
MYIQGGSSNPQTSDVGGSALSFTPQAAIHGGVAGDQRQLMQGLPLTATSSGNTSDFQVNIASIQELTIDTAALSAEDNSGGVRMNVIPREGGNQFHVTFYADGSGPSLQSSNYTDSLAARGFPQPNPLKPLDKAYTVNPGVGGPIVKDKLWFYGAVNRQRQSTVVAVAPNLNAGNPNAWTYVPNPSGTFPKLDVLFYGENGRLTWQATPKNKLAFYYDTQARCTCPQADAAKAPEAQSQRFLPTMRFTSITYTAPISNRMVVDVAALDRLERVVTGSALGIDPSLVPVVDNGTGITYRNNASESGNTLNRNQDLRGSLSYVTGAHAMKVGFQSEWSDGQPYNYLGTTNLTYRFTNGVPNQLTEFADPRNSETKANEFGLFAQDRWTLNKLTLNGGIRLDYYHTFFPDQTLGPVTFAPTRNISFPAQDGASLKDPSWRMGLAYDVFGNGKTAIKASFSKYLNAMNTGTAGTGVYNLGYQLNPANRIATSTTRNWTDTNKNFIPDCNLQNPLANGECGALANSGFGQPITTLSYDPSLLNSFNKRLYNKEFLVGVQQQVLERVSLDVTYLRRSFGNYIVTDNLATAPSDFQQFSITVPTTDSRLPNAGGTISGLYDLNPAKFGQVNNYTTLASNYGDLIRVWQGVDILANFRAAAGLTFQGGISTGDTHQDNCAISAALPEWVQTGGTGSFYAVSPTSAWYCNVTTSWITQVKGLGTYAIPKVGASVSVAFQSNPGPIVAANLNVTNALASPSLGRNLSGGSATVNLLPPGQQYGERMTNVDIRLSKSFHIGHARVAGNLDLYNLFNASNVIIQNDTFSTTTAATWQTPQTVQAPRLIKLGAQFDF